MSIDIPKLSDKWDAQPKPYLILKMPIEYQKSITRSILAKLGIRNASIINKEISIRITGYKNIIHAINFILTPQNNYPLPPLSDDLTNQLIDYKKKCEILLELKEKEKPPLPPAIKSRLISDYIKIVKGSLPASANVTHLVIKTKSPSKEYVFKENRTGRSISEIEFFNGLCYDVLLDDSHPKTRAVDIGLLSKKFSYFESLHSILKHTGNFPSSEELLEAKVGKVWFAAYVEDENDLHGGNYGYGPNGEIVKLDNDQSSFPHTSEYSGIQSDIPNSEFDYPIAPIHAFPVTKNDITHFPILKDAHPRNWPDRSDGKRIDVDFFVKNKEFIKQKYDMALKRILIPDELYQSFGKVIRSPKKREKLVKYKIEKTKTLKNVLLAMPEFKQYILNNPDVINEIISDFGRYNKKYKKPEDKEFQIDLEKIKNDFEQLKQQIFGEKLKGELTKLLSQFKNIKDDYNDSHNLDRFSDLENYIENILNTIKEINSDLSVSDLSDLTNAIIHTIDFILEPAEPDILSSYIQYQDIISKKKWGKNLGNEMIYLKNEINYVDTTILLSKINDDNSIPFYIDILKNIQMILTLAEGVKKQLKSDDIPTLISLLNATTKLIKNPKNSETLVNYENHIKIAMESEWGGKIAHEMKSLKKKIDLSIFSKELLDCENEINGIILLDDKTKLCTKDILNAIKEFKNENEITSEIPTLTQYLKSFKQLMKHRNPDTILNYRQSIRELEKINNKKWIDEIIQPSKKFNTDIIIPDLLQSEILAILDGNNKHQGIRKIVDFANQADFKKILIQGKQLTSSFSLTNEFMKNPADSLQQAVKQYSQNATMYEDISSLTDLLSAQQKRNAIIKFEKEIRRLSMPVAGASLYGAVIVPDAYKNDPAIMRKITAYKILIRALKNSNANESLAYVLNTNKEAIDVLSKTRGIMKATSYKVIEKLLELKQPQDMINDLKKKEKQGQDVPFQAGHHQRKTKS